MIASARLLAALAPIALLAGCVSFGSEPPPSLLTLTPDATVAAGKVVTGTSDSAIAIMEPDAPVKLSVTRLPVQMDESNIAYLKDAVWVDRPSRLFRQLLAETVRAQSGRIVLSGGDPIMGASMYVRGTLREFGYDAPSSSVIVRFDAVRDLGNGVIETRRFESTVPGVVAEAGPVSVAINRAANDVAHQVAQWIGG